ncbi:MAG TPA: GNAT family N-acetyltransferase [Candidatus Luteococcus avicola]|nr:GNAT family N-acetyltransferase [Candidatus Luteococcus avicola]
MSSHSYTIRLATPDDAPGYSHCYVESLAETYAHIMPPEFAASRRDDIVAGIEEHRAELQRMADALADGREPERTHWVALDDAGEVVGIVSSGLGVPHWESHLYDNPPPPVELNLDHIYTRASTHGTGLGQRLLEVAVPDGRGAWLWILRENPRAEAFYARNGFVPDGLEVNCGPAWFGRPMFRMWRPNPSVPATASD